MKIYRCIKDYWFEDTHGYVAFTTTIYAGQLFMAESAFYLPGQVVLNARFYEFYEEVKL